MTPQFPANLGDEAATIAGLPTPFDPSRTPGTTPNSLSDNTRRFFSGPEIGAGMTEHRRSGYQKLEDLGTWEFGTIQLAEHTQLKRRVRLIVLESPWSEDPAIQQWFLSTSRILASLQHHRVDGTVLEVVEEGGIAVAISEREMGDIRQWSQLAMTPQADWGYDPIARACLDAVQGLDAIHRAGLVMGVLRIEHLAWDEDSQRVLLRPFQTGLPSTLLAPSQQKDKDEEEKVEVVATDAMRRDDYRQLGQALSGALGSGVDDPHWSPRRACRRFPLLRPPLAKWLARMRRQGINSSQSQKLQLTLSSMATQHLKAIGWGSRFQAAFLDFLLVFVGVGVLAILWAIVDVYLFNLHSMGDFSIVVFGWLLFYLVGWETLWNMRPATSIMGIRFLHTSGSIPSVASRGLRTLLRLGVITTFTLPAIVGMRAVEELPLFSLSIGETDSFLLMLVGSAACLLLYGTAFWRKGVPLHDWFSGVRLVHYVYTSDEQGRISALERIPGPATPAFQSLFSPDRTVIGPYQLGEEIGQGGMGTVYRGVDTTLGRPVAIKVISNAMQNAEVMARFQREAQLAANLDHPHIAKVYSVGLWDNQPYMAMEYVEGKNLQQVVSESGRLSVPRAWDIIHQAATGLKEAALQGIVHRDIKPSNLMITPQGIVKVMDFGISKLLGDEMEITTSRSLLDLEMNHDVSLTRTGALMGTPQFMSPEQTRGEVLDARSDIYSLGLTLYFLLSGSSPYEGSQLYELIIKQCTEKLPPLPEKLLGPQQQRLLDCMLAKASEERFQDYDALIDALDQTFPALPTPGTAMRRVTATMIDLLAMYLLKRGIEAFAPEGWGSHFHFTAALLAFGLVFLSTIRLAATPGMWLLRLRYESADEKPLQWYRLLLRLVCKWPMWIVMFLHSILQMIGLPLTPFATGMTTFSGMAVGWFLWIGSYILLQYYRLFSVFDLVGKTKVFKIPDRSP